MRSQVLNRAHPGVSFVSICPESIHVPRLQETDLSVKELWEMCACVWREGQVYTKGMVVLEWGIMGVLFRLGTDYSQGNQV